jgi:hypothetical protein
MQCAGNVVKVDMFSPCALLSQKLMRAELLTDRTWISMGSIHMATDEAEAKDRAKAVVVVKEREEPRVLLRSALFKLEVMTVAQSPMGTAKHRITTVLLMMIH